MPAIIPPIAGVTQLAECGLSKPNVEGSTPFARFFLFSINMKQSRIFFLATTMLLAMLFQTNSMAAPSMLQKKNDGVVLLIGEGQLKIQVYADDIIRVLYARDASFFTRQSLSALPNQKNLPNFEVTNNSSEAIIKTAKLSVHVDMDNGAISFFDSAGNPILSEKSETRTLTPANVQGEKTFHVQQQWQPAKNESLYGLGQHQLGLMDIKGYDLDLWQHNGTVIIPLLVSSKGYGIFWDNTSFTRFGDLRDAETIPANFLFDADGKSGGLTGSYFDGAHFGKLVGKRVDSRVHIDPPRNPNPTTQHVPTTEASAPLPWRSNKRIFPDLIDHGDISIRWEGEIEPPETGDYTFETYSNAGIKVWINDSLVIDHWRQGWLPWLDVAKVRLDAHRRAKIRVEWSKDQGDEQLDLRWKTPSESDATSLWSEVGDGIDYYFIYGPRIDQVVSGYRQITGQAPLMPRWAFGLWQSRQRYETAQQITDVLAGFRSRAIPIDNIVEDWFYWKADAWGSHEFDPARFPDPAGLLKTVHEQFHAHFMISVWPKFYPGTKNFDEMQSRGFLYQRNLKEKIHDWVGFVYTFYDAFNPEAGKLFWAQIEKNLLPLGIDGWWLDATEPDLTKSPTLQGQRDYMHPTALGSGSRVLNAFPLCNSKAVYEGQREAAPNQRVFILTRSAFAGMQRYAAATWSGDISSTWEALQKQIPAGLSFGLSGMPYWSMDIGGFSVPPRFSSRNPKPEDVEEWRELNARWFEFGTFVPLLRVHGEFPHREMWEFGGEKHPAYLAMLKFDQLRYRLMPYIYSLAGQVTQENGTIMRALVMDFPEDATAREIGNQYMFGPAVLVSPITTFKSRQRKVYLPASTGWYDFWTGAFLKGGQTIDAAAELDAIPLHVRAGSIIPFGPPLQYTDEKPADPITLFVYTGADAEFVLYEDEGVNYNYEKGAFAKIAFNWNQADKSLTIGKRAGTFPGMLQSAHLM